MNFIPKLGSQYSSLLSFKYIFNYCQTNPIRYFAKGIEVFTQHVRESGLITR